MNAVPVLSTHTHILEQSRQICLHSTMATSSVKSPHKSHTCHLLITSFCLRGGMSHGADDVLDGGLDMAVFLEFLSFSHPLNESIASCFGADNLTAQGVVARPHLDHVVSTLATDMVARTKAGVHVLPLLAPTASLLDDDFTRFVVVHDAYVCFMHSFKLVLLHVEGERPRRLRGHVMDNTPISSPKNTRLAFRQFFITASETLEAYWCCVSGVRCQSDG